MRIEVLLDMAAEVGDEREAVVRGTHRLTFAGLQKQARRGAGIIRDAGAQHIVLVGRNGPIVPLALFSAAQAGIPFVPLNYRLGADQLRDLLGEIANPLVVVDEDYRRIFDDQTSVITSTEFAERCAQTSEEPVSRDEPVDDRSAAVLLFTSGTTARPKIVSLSHDNLTSYVLGTVEFSSADEDDTSLSTVPPYHIAAIGSILSNLFSGRRVVYLPDFDAGEWLRLVRDERITTAMVVPTMMARIVEELEARGMAEADAPSLAALSYGGARMPRPVLDRAMRLFPTTGFANAYGLTETSSTIAILGPDDHRLALSSSDPAVQARLSSVGQPVPGMEMQIRAEDGSLVRPGESGDLWVRGAQVSGRYVGLGSALDADGWFPTKDLAHLDDEGYLFIEGRSDDTIIRGGENISPHEIECVLLEHPAVREGAVLGVADDEWGQRLVAVVVPHPGSTASQEDIRSFIRARLRGSRTPDEVVWRDSLPYTATGKLLRRELVLALTPIS